jgi:predicted  nucleic acid-binding Zn-ribbon protein
VAKEGQHDHEHLKKLENIVDNQQKLLSNMDKRISLLEQIADRIEKWAEKSLEMHYRLDGVTEQQAVGNKRIDDIERKAQKNASTIKWIIGVGTGLMTALTIANFVITLIR